MKRQNKSPEHIINRKSFAPLIPLTMGLFILAGCDSLPKGEIIEEERESIFGPGGLTFGGPDSGARNTEPTGGIGVNSFLWRAALDTVSFMPLSSADPFGGVILTDWYSPPGTPNERFKITVYILDRRLRADALRTAVFRQLRSSAQASWQDSAIRPETTTELEDAILTRARQFRISYTDALD